MFFKDANCNFSRTCKLDTPCDGCKLPEQLRMYDELMEFKTKYLWDRDDRGIREIAELLSQSIRIVQQEVDYDDFEEV